MKKREFLTKKKTHEQTMGNTKKKQTIQEQLAELKEEYLGLYTYKEELETVHRNTAYVRYINLIGRGEFELFHLEIEVKALKLKVKLAQAYLNRQQRPDAIAIEQRISRLWKDYENELMSKINLIKGTESMTSVSRALLEDCKTIYHMLVKRLHPDLHPELSEELHDMLIAAHAAYKLHDINALRRIAIKYQLMVEDEPIGSIVDIQTHISHLKSQIELLNAEIKELKSSFPLNYQERLDDEDWVRQQQDLMSQKREILLEEKSQLEEKYSLQIGD